MTRKIESKIHELIEAFSAVIFRPYDPHPRITELEASIAAQNKRVQELEWTLAAARKSYAELETRNARQCRTIRDYQELVSSRTDKQTGVYKPGDTVTHTSQRFVAGIGRVVKCPVGPGYAAHDTSSPAEKLIWVAWPNGLILGHYAFNLLHA